MLRSFQALFLPMVWLSGCELEPKSTCDRDGDGYEVASCGGCDQDDRDPSAPDVRWYPDADGDGHGADSEGVAACDPPPGFVDSHDDCDDDASWTNPESVETCDEADNDCDGEVDEGLSEWYPDADGDGYGDASVEPFVTCTPDLGMVADHSDCDDRDASIHPGAIDTFCDGIDGDCDGSGQVAVAVVEGDEFDDLQAAVDAAPNGGLVVVCPGTHEADISVSWGRTLTFDSLSETAKDTVLSGADAHAILETYPGATVTIEHLAFTAGRAEVPSWGTDLGEYGGAIAARDTDLTVRDCIFRGNTANSEGGAVYAVNVDDQVHTFSIESSLFEENSSEYGGAVLIGGYGAGGPDEVSVIGCQFDRNEAHSGGAIHFETRRGSTLRISDGMFDANTSSYEAGAIYGSMLDIEDSVFTNNSASYDAGVINVGTCNNDEDRCSVFISSSQFEGNSTPGYCAVLDAEGDPESTVEIVLQDSSFTGNTANEDAVIGGYSGIYRLQATRCDFVDNLASRVDAVFRAGHLGDFTSTESMELTFEDCRFEGNEASGWTIGVIEANGPTDVTFRRCQILSNVADPGDLMFYATTWPPWPPRKDSHLNLLFEDTTIEGNVAGQDYSVLNVNTNIPSDTTLVFEGGSLVGNTSSEGLGAIYWCEQSPLSIVDADWGEGANDNTPCDLILYDGWSDAETSFCAFGSDATVDCPGDGTCASP
jgi:hypothetical protein